jgi:Flp pilus assembly protein CpaB
MIEVLVARAEVRPGTFLAAPEEFFEKRSVPESEIGAYPITNMDQLRGRMVLKVIAAGSPVRTNQIEQSADAFNRKPWAMAIRVTTHCLGRIIGPGARVDLISVEKDADNPDQPVEKLILRNMSILGYHIPSGSEREPGIPYVIITVAVKPNEVELLARMIRNGIPVAVSRPEKSLDP